MYLIQCRECRTRISDQATLCSVCGSLLFYRHAPADTTPRHERPVVRTGETRWLEGA